MAEILIAEDDLTVRKAYRKLFECERHTVTAVRNGKEALESFTEHRPDLVLLDVDMPVMNGFVTCQAMREMDRFIPILFLTAKDTDADQMRGLGVGADDYIFKSVTDAILLARVNVLLERRALYDQAFGAQTREIKLGRVHVNRETMEVFHGERRIAQLTKTEAAILQTLNDERGRYYSRDEIAEMIHGGPYSIEPSAIRSYFANLRRKLGAAGALIVNERDRGYRLLK